MSAQNGGIIIDWRQAMPPDSPAVELEVVGSSSPSVTPCPAAAAGADADIDHGGGTAEFSHMSDQQLQVGIIRCEGMAKQGIHQRTPDGGEKMQARVLRMKKELERRRARQWKDGTVLRQAVQAKHTGGSRGEIYDFKSDDETMDSTASKYYPNSSCTTPTKTYTQVKGAAYKEQSSLSHAKCAYPNNGGQISKESLSPQLKTCAHLPKSRTINQQENSTVNKRINATFGSNRRMTDKADWCDANVRHFIDICKGEIEAGNRPLGMFTRVGWKNLVTKYEEKTGLKQTKKQLKNKLDNMKKEYTWFMELKNSATSLGWNEAKQTVDCSNEWWDEHLTRCNNPDKGIKCNHVRFKKQGPKHLDDLHMLFDKIHVSGASASCPGDNSSDDSSDEDVGEIQKPPDNDDVKLAALKKSKPGKKKRKESSTAIDEKDEKSPFFRMYKNTCLKIETAAEKISTSVEASSAPPTSQVPSIAEAMKMVKDCGVQEKTDLMHTATFLIMKPEFREVFSMLETKEGRFDLLEREHAKELMRRT